MVGNNIRVSSMIKEALDNLPVGVCFFDEQGVPLLVNRTMNELAYALNGRDIQSLSELKGMLESPDEVETADGRMWKFSRRRIAGDITEITAADITTLHRKKRELIQSNAEQREIMDRLELMGRDVVSITRSEEILALKMKIHNDLGYAISSTRRFISSEIPAEEKREFIAQQRRMAAALMGEAMSGSDEPDIFAELLGSARKLGTDIVLEGEIPEGHENLMTSVIRECLINAVRHAGGDTVFVKSSAEGGKYRAVITNNGAPPSQEIVEGGGLTSLRKSVEQAGGEMRVESKPKFVLTVEIEIRNEK